MGHYSIWWNISNMKYANVGVTVDIMYINTESDITNINRVIYIGNRKVAK